MKTYTLKLLFVFILLILLTEILEAKYSIPASSLQTTATSGLTTGTTVVSITATATTICSGTPVTFTAIVTGAATTAQWIWRKNNKTIAINSINSVYYTDASLIDKDVISFILVTPGSASGTDTLISNAITVQVNKITNVLKDTIMADADSVILDAGPGCSTYKWNTGDTTQKITVTEFGKYTVTLANSSGCTASYSSYVSLVKARIVTHDTTVCKGSMVPISLGRTKDLYDTTQIDQFTVSSFGYFNKVIKTSEGGTYFYKVSGTLSYWPGKCDALDAYYNLRDQAPVYSGSLNINCNYYATPTPLSYNPTHYYTSSIFLTNATPIQFSFADNVYSDNCGSLNFIIYKVSPRPTLHILWSTGDTTATIQVYPTTTTTYTATVTDGLTTSMDSMTVRVTAPVTPSITVKITKTDSCAGKPISFTALAVNGGENPIYQWKINATNVGDNSDSYSTTTLADKDIVNCLLTSTTACVTSPTAVSANLPVTIYPNITPTVSITASSSHICEGSNLTFSAATTNEGETPDYQWLLNNKAVGSNSYKYATISLADQDVIRCVTSVKNSLPCMTTKEALSDPLAITVYPDPTIEVGGDREMFKGQHTQLSSSISGAASLEWTPASYLSNDTICNPVAAPVENITYTVKAVSQYGCTSSASVKVKVLEGLTIPNVFSPNGDGINDTWMISGFGNFPAATVSIFNRYGQPVFQSYGYNIPWNGNMNGSPLPVATYYYVINLGDQFTPVSGSVTVLR